MFHLTQLVDRRDGIGRDIIDDRKKRFDTNPYAISGLGNKPVLHRIFILQACYHTPCYQWDHRRIRDLINHGILSSALFLSLPELFPVCVSELAFSVCFNAAAVQGLLKSFRKCYRRHRKDSQIFCRHLPHEIASRSIDKQNNLE